MNHELKQIQDDILQGQTSPVVLAEYRVKLSGFHAYLSGQIEEILAKKPGIWNEIRKTVASDKSAERAWEGTEMGIKEMRIRLNLKSIDKMFASIGSLLRVKENELRNLM